MTDKTEPQIHENKGRFWGGLLATVLMSLGGAGAATSVMGQENTQHAAQAAAKESERIERAVAIYLDALRPQIEQGFDDAAKEREALDNALESCLKLATEADKQSFAALLAIEIRHGRRAAEKAMAQADDQAAEELPPAPRSPRVQKGAQHRLPIYQLAAERSPLD